jgi:excisionase family DNA binding protein
LEGSGSVDVSLEKENLKIAAEVSVTTADYETRNVRKSLASGYDFVVVVSSQKKKIPLLQKKIYDEISIAQREQVRVLCLPDFFAFLRGIASPEDARDKKKKPNGQRMSFSETCEFFGIGASTLYRWIREGRVPFYRIGREYQFDREELVLIGRHDLSGKRKATVRLETLKIEKRAPKSKKEQDERYRKMLKMD